MSRKRETDVVAPAAQSQRSLQSRTRLTFIRGWGALTVMTVSVTLWHRMDMWQAAKDNNRGGGGVGGAV